MNAVLSEIKDLNKGISQFNEGNYCGAHEAWEDLWFNEKDADEQNFLHGLILAAGSFQHYIRRECKGANDLLLKSIPLLQAGLNAHPNLRLFDFIQALDSLRHEFSSCSFAVDTTSLPKIARMYIYC